MTLHEHVPNSDMDLDHDPDGGNSSPHDCPLKPTIWFLGLLNMCQQFTPQLLLDLERPT